MLVRRVANQAVCWSNPQAEALEGEDVSRNTSELDSASLPVKVAELRRKLYQKAKQEPKFRFYALYDRIYRRDVLTAAWWIILAKDKAPGIDCVTCQGIMDAPGGVQQYLDELHESLRTKTYRPDRVQRTYIAKPDGRLRPLGIPTMRDRIVQTAATLVLEAIMTSYFYVWRSESLIDPFYNSLKCG